MLKKLIRLQNVGLLRNGAPKPVVFEQVALVFAENGRGKSTVASILTAAATLDANTLEQHQTIDSDEKPEVELLFVNDQGATNPLKLSHGVWTGSVPDIHVFDPGFVESNVFSGQEIRADQRQSLLQFALGEGAVKLEKELAALVPQISEATKRETDATKRIAAFARGMSSQDFIKLQDVPDAEAQIDALRSRIEAAKNLAPLSQRPMPASLPQIELDIGALFKILQTDFAGMRADAKEAVLGHFQRHGNPEGMEAWVAQGRRYVTGDDCPFCGKDLKDADLLGAYDAYFNETYNTTMKQVATLARGVEARLSDARSRSWCRRSMQTRPALRLGQIS
jgi:wobble nucleotide-excising tRNase